MNERLQKLIAHAGVASRRQAEELIKEGRVTVDGTPAHLGQKIDPETAHVEIDGVPLPVAPGVVTYLLNKPRGVISTASDPRGRRTVVDLVGADQRLYPVGRLDVDSEGLILVSNDGELTELLTHPRYQVPKTYVVSVRGDVSEAMVRRFRRGVHLDDGFAKPRRARVLERAKHRALVEVVMTEGRNREIRRMCDAVGWGVDRLVRTAIGSLRDQTLKPGEARLLSVGEIRSLYEAAQR